MKVPICTKVELFPRPTSIIVVDDETMREWVRRVTFGYQMSLYGIAAIPTQDVGEWYRAPIEPGILACPAGDPCPGTGCSACCPSYDPCHELGCRICGETDPVHHNQLVGRGLIHHKWNEEEVSHTDDEERQVAKATAEEFERGRREGAAENSLVEDLADLAFEANLPTREEAEAILGVEVEETPEYLAEPPEGTKYPLVDGDVLVLGPEVFVSADGTTICWRGENFVRAEGLIRDSHFKLSRDGNVVEYDSKVYVLAPTREELARIQKRREAREYVRRQDDSARQREAAARGAGEHELKEKALHVALSSFSNGRPPLDAFELIQRAENIYRWLTERGPEVSTPKS